jgi:hypothetical protein
MNPVKFFGTNLKYLQVIFTHHWKLLQKTETPEEAMTGDSIIAPGRSWSGSSGPIYSHSDTNRLVTVEAAWGEIDHRQNFLSGCRLLLRCCHRECARLLVEEPDAETVQEPTLELFELPLCRFSWSCPTPLRFAKFANILSAESREISSVLDTILHPPPIQPVFPIKYRGQRAIACVLASDSGHLIVDGR